MRARRGRVAFLAALLSVVAGCMGGAPPPADAGDEARAPQAPGSSPLPWGFSGCRAVTAYVAVDAQRLAPHLPAGFRPRSPSEVRLDVPGVGDAVLGVEAARCASIRGVEGAVAQAPYARFFTFVEPPPAWRHEHPDARHLVKWDTLIADEDLRAVLATAGVPVRAGEVALEKRLWPEPLDAHGVTALLSFEGTEHHELNGAFAAQGEDASGLWVEFSSTPRGLVRWILTVEDSDVTEGRGYLRAPEGSLARELTGVERAPALVSRRLVEAAEGAIELAPGRAP